MATEVKKDNATPEGGAGSEPARHQRDVEFENDLRTMIKAAGFAETVAIRTAVQNLVDEVKTLRAANAEIPALTAKAKDGEAYRKSLIEDAIKAGKRALGEEYDEAHYRSILENLPLESIKRMTEDWNKTGDKRFPGGRETGDGVETTPAEKPRSVIPSKAFIS